MLTWLLKPLEPGPLNRTRIMIGAAAAARSLIALPLLLRLSDPQILKTPVFDWMPTPSRPLAFVLVAIWLGSACLLALGWKVHLSGLTLLSALAFMLALDLQTYANHLYLMAWVVLLLVVSDAGAGSRFDPSQRPVARWPVMLIMMQVSVVYLFSALTKINESFLSGQVLAGVLRDGLIPFPDSLRTPAFLGVVAGGAVVTEVFLAFALWLPRLRLIAFVVGALFHLTVALLMADTLELGVFAMLMLAIYPLFRSTLPPARSHAVAAPALTSSRGLP